MPNQITQSITVAMLKPHVSAVCLLICSLACIVTYPMAAMSTTTPTVSDENIQTYPVYGNNLQAVMADINANTQSPRGAFGYTQLQSSINWTSTQYADNTCEVSDVTFDKTIVIYMPEWHDKHLASQCLQDSWTSVWNAVLLHEERHRDIYLLLNEIKIEARIKDIGKQENCAVLDEKVNTTYNTIMRENQRLHDAFHATEPTPVLTDC